MAEKYFFVYMQMREFSTRNFNQIGVKKVGLSCIASQQTCEINWSTWKNVLNYLWWNVVSQNWMYVFQITDIRKKFAVLKTLWNV